MALPAMSVTATLTCGARESGVRARRQDQLSSHAFPLSPRSIHMQQRGTASSAAAGAWHRAGQQQRRRLQPRGHGHEAGARVRPPGCHAHNAMAGYSYTHNAMAGYALRRTVAALPTEDMESAPCGSTCRARARLGDAGSGSTPYNGRGARKACGAFTAAPRLVGLPALCPATEVGPTHRVRMKCAHDAGPAWGVGALGGRRGWWRKGW